MRLVVEETAPGILGVCRILVFILLVVACSRRAGYPANRLTLSGGWTRQIGGYSFKDKQTATDWGCPSAADSKGISKLRLDCSRRWTQPAPSASLTAAWTLATTSSGFRSAFASSHRCTSAVSNSQAAGAVSTSTPSAVRRLEEVPHHAMVGAGTLWRSDAVLWTIRGTSG